MLCEYSKFRIESNSYFSIRFKASTTIRNTQGSSREWCLSKNPYVYSAVVNNVQVMYLLEVFILAHYGPPTTETPTTETTTARCHKNSWIYLTCTYYWWLTVVETDDNYSIRFEISNISSTIRFKMKKPLFAQHYWQISSKSILIISSYTVSELGHFLRHSVVLVRTRGLHGNGDGGNTTVTAEETAVMGTTFTVIPWGRDHVSRGYRGDGEQCRR